MKTLPNNSIDNPMIARVIPKAHTQKMIRALRDAGLPVNKLNAGYECRHPKTGELLFRAMNGARGYLCRFKADLFV